MNLRVQNKLLYKQPERLLTQSWFTHFRCLNVILQIFIVLQVSSITGLGRKGGLQHLMEQAVPQPMAEAGEGGS